MNHNFVKRLRTGERLIGTMVTLDSTAVAELLATVGFDWLFVDAEHGPLSPSDIQHILQAAGRETPCLVRIATSDMINIKALDAGAAGIIAPMVNTAEKAQELVSHAKYPPFGTRGVGISRAHGYGLKIEEYIDNANEGTAVVIQAEHIEAVENIEAIVQVPGIDAVFVGPYDLSASMGLIGQFTHPQVVAAIDHIRAVCQEANIALGAFGVSAEAVLPYIERGYTLIVTASDTLLLGQAASGVLNEVKSHTS